MVVRQVGPAREKVQADLREEVRATIESSNQLSLLYHKCIGPIWEKVENCEIV